ncbi:T9SS type A sorting domain-containing protein [Chryseobacterium sp. Ch-15]|uniref:T9SS type A sorting domain-containing protein n=1 Tax=Chryseobacterium muglaense TaxID=2893752 RepID=A0A9Q3YT51_9FLAO|nr:GEVED domain-containing protein [Chryseobacterium muglaense]MBD3903267.1 T9SS type A sorting domain-containing protein [Chryseobacterium muglaense]MCC9036098.1 T9SS type A sorting domain-containing protein [Chryseobacterium muglaense]MCM2553326.1 T9SS type A sorting domain-containing protein [Chryseobacterium muglaense]
MTSDSEGSNYTDYTADSSRLIKLTKGSTDNTISVTKVWTDGEYAEGVAVWVDFNNDKIFDDSEKIASTEANTEPTATVSFNVPANAYFVDEVIRMRVAMRYFITRDNPCESFNYGEVEDYAVKISEFLAVDDLTSSDLKFYPNPVNDVLNINTTGIIQKVEIYNMAGQNVLSSNEIDKSQINMTSLKSGVYIVKITIDGNVEDLKVIKK